MVSDEKVAVPEHRITAMQKFMLPVTNRDLRSFLEAMLYYRHFICDLAEGSDLLSPATPKKSPNIVQWVWIYWGPFTISGLGISTTLNVVRDRKFLLVTFYAKQLHGAQVRYSSD